MKCCTNKARPSLFFKTEKSNNNSLSMKFAFNFRFANDAVLWQGNKLMLYQIVLMQHEQKNCSWTLFSCSWINEIAAPGSNSRKNIILSIKELFLMHWNYHNQSCQLYVEVLWQHKNHKVILIWAFWIKFCNLQQCIHIILFVVIDPLLPVAWPLIP